MEARDNAERVHLLQLSCDTELVVITDHAACLNLKKIADRYEENTNRRLQSIIAILEPTLVIILSVIVGLILLSVILPLMGIMTSIG